MNRVMNRNRDLSVCTVLHIASIDCLRGGAFMLVEFEALAEAGVGFPDCIAKSPVEEGGYAVRALSGGTLNKPPLRLPPRAFDSISFMRTNWYFRRVGNKVCEKMGCGRERLREIAIMTESLSSSESTGPAKDGSRSSSMRAGALASIAASDRLY